MQARAKDADIPKRDVGWHWVFGKLLLIFQMPKTGSQTVEASLQQCSLPHQIVRCHFLSAHRMVALHRAAWTSSASKTWKRQLHQQLAFTLRVSSAVRLRNLLRSCGIRIPKLEIITAVREPVSLALSSVFQNYQIGRASCR